MGVWVFLWVFGVGFWGGFGSPLVVFFFFLFLFCFFFLFFAVFLFLCSRGGVCGVCLLCLFFLCFFGGGFLVGLLCVLVLVWVFWWLYFFWLLFLGVFFGFLLGCFFIFQTYRSFELDSKARSLLQLLQIPSIFASLSDGDPGRPS